MPHRSFAAVALLVSLAITGCRSVPTAPVMAPPVNRSSVESIIHKAVRTPLQSVEWSGDQELLFSLQQGCGSIRLSMSGAQDLKGRVLDSGKNPVLWLHRPCHGSNYRLVQLSSGEEPAGWPTWAGLVDTDSATGLVLGRNGTVYFLLEGEVVRWIGTAEGGWASFLPDGSILLTDSSAVRILDHQGQVLRESGLPSEVTTGLLTSDGREAILLLKEGGAVRVELATGAVRGVRLVGPSTEWVRLIGLPGSEWILAVPDQGEPWLWDLATGEIETVSGPPLIYSPDGQWVVDAGRGGVFRTASEEGAEPHLSLTEAMEAKAYPYALWTKDSTHLLMPGGQVIRVETGEEAGTLKPLGSCGRLIPLRLDKVGSELVAAFLQDCY